MISKITKEIENISRYLSDIEDLAQELHDDLEKSKEREQKLMGFLDDNDIEYHT